jgi:hypothetical protein
MGAERIRTRPITGVVAVMLAVVVFAACGGQTSGGPDKTDAGGTSSSGGGSGSDARGSSGSGSGGAGADAGLDGSQSIFGDSGLDASCIALYQACTLTSVCCFIVPLGASCVSDMCLPNHGQ